MNELLRFIRLEGGQAEILPLWEALFAIAVALACSAVVALVYRYTHTTLSYSPSYAQTLVLTSMVTALIMIVIGSNIARAFSLVGALSIIRFRNAIKETRDVGYIFFAMAAAMAAGTRFYALALAATGMISCVMIFLHAIRFGAAAGEPERLLKVRLPAGTPPMALLEGVFKELFDSYSTVLLETVRQGLAVDAVFSVRCRPGVTETDVLQKISAVDENLKVTYHLALHAEEI